MTRPSAAMLGVVALLGAVALAAAAGENTAVQDASRIPELEGNDLKTILAATYVASRVVTHTGTAAMPCHAAARATRLSADPRVAWL